MAIGPNPDEFFAELDKAGEDEIRKRLAQGVYGDRKRGLVEEWLARKDRQREESRAAQEQDHSVSELAISRSVKNAAWSAVWISVVALILSVIAILK